MQGDVGDGCFMTTNYRWVDDKMGGQLQEQHDKIGVSKES